MSCFGIGGSNAHAILREAPDALPAHASRPSSRESRVELLTLSARTPSALQSLVEHMACHLDAHPQLRLPDVCFTANTGRASFEHRIAVLARSMDELREQLLLALRATPSPHVLHGTHRTSERVLVGFAFDEHPLTPDAARAVLEAHPVIERSLEQSERVLAPYLPKPLREVMRGGSRDDRELLTKPRYAHAVSISAACALVSLYRELGVEPFAVYGNGVGEYAAAAAAGSIAWESAIVLATRRGALVESFTPGAQQLVTLRQLERELSELDRSAVTPAIPFFSAALGRALAPDEAPDSMFFARQLLLTPARSTAVEALSALGCTLCVELGPDASNAASASAHALTALGVESSDLSLVHALAELYVRGAPLDWRAFHSGRGARKLSLPTYPFERQRHWLDFPPRPSSLPTRPATTERRTSHPLISRMRVSQPPPSASGFFDAEPERAAETEPADAAAEPAAHERNR